MNIDKLAETLKHHTTYSDADRDQIARAINFGLKHPLAFSFPDSMTLVEQINAMEEFLKENENVYSNNIESCTVRSRET